jgi:hypothetical protein
VGGRGKEGRTWTCDVGPALVLNVGLVGEPLDALAEGVHVGVLKYVDGHDDLVKSGLGEQGATWGEGEGRYRRWEMAWRVMAMSQSARWAMREMWFVPSM